jgi:hypothetical protein
VQSITMIKLSRWSKLGLRIGPFILRARDLPSSCLLKRLWAQSSDSIIPAPSILHRSYAGLAISVPCHGRYGQVF